MNVITFEEAKFLDLLVTVFLKELEVTETYLAGADFSEIKIQAFSVRKKLRSFKPEAQESTTGDNGAAPIAKSEEAKA